MQLHMFLCVFIVQVYKDCFLNLIASKQVVSSFIKIFFESYSKQTGSQVVSTDNFDD